MGYMAAVAQDIDLGILLALGYQEFVRELREGLARKGFEDTGRSDGYVFRALAAGPLTISELAGLLGMTKQGAGQIVDDMERRGYLDRQPDPRDGRARLLGLTTRGQDALAAARAFHRRYERRLIRTHGPEALATLRAVVGTMAGATLSDPRPKVLHA
jgi:DNA-binding MarR family transcriptional regulator